MTCWYGKMKKSKIVTFCCEYQSLGPRDLVEFKGRFYPHEVSVPPKVCIGWDDRENPPLLLLTMRRMLLFSLKRFKRLNVHCSHAFSSGRFGTGVCVLTCVRIKTHTVIPNLGSVIENPFGNKSIYLLCLS